MNSNILYSTSITTPIGNMSCIASDSSLYLLEFSDAINIALESKKLELKYCSNIIQSCNKITSSIQEELGKYFSGHLMQFSTAFIFSGSEFQNLVWQNLKEIPYGKTISYKEQAGILNKPLAFRAVANANSKNQLSIIIPCHRIINNNGKLGGYKAGLARKKWLLDHESSSLHA